MKAKSILFVSILLSCLFSVISCSDKDDDKGGSGDKSENQVINEWIHEAMSTNYFWNEQMPKSTTLNFNNEPKSFFYSTLNKYTVVDKYSYLIKNGVPQFADHETASTSSQTVTNDIGFEFGIFLVDGGAIELLVTYIKKGAEAGKQGLERGDWIRTIDGVALNEGNYKSILYPMLENAKASYILTLRDKSPITLISSASDNINPIHTYKTFLINNKNIGYVLYNSFANGKDDNSYDYAIEMNNEVLKLFEAKKIDELILDLRYNGGGLVQSGTYIASAIAPNRSGKIYTRRNYNNILEKNASYAKSKNNYFYDEITTSRTKHTIPQLNLKRLYVLTSRQTASASEQIINGLGAYLEKVHIIGETTTGKNMESFPIPGKDEASEWVLHALTSVSYRSDKNVEENDYSKGFPPTVGWQGINEKGQLGFHYENDEFQTLREQREFYDLGNPDETLLAKALEHITGIKKIAPRMAKEPAALHFIGSSLDRKRQEMIIENQE